MGVCCIFNFILPMKSQDRSVRSWGAYWERIACFLLAFLLDRALDNVIFSISDRGGQFLVPAAAGKCVTGHPPAFLL